MENIPEVKKDQVDAEYGQILDVDRRRPGGIKAVDGSYNKDVTAFMVKNFV